MQQNAVERRRNHGDQPAFRDEEYPLVAREIVANPRLVLGGQLHVRKRRDRADLARAVDLRRPCLL